MVIKVNSGVISHALKILGKENFEDMSIAEGLKFFKVNEDWCMNSIARN